MNPHLQAVREFRKAHALPQAGVGNAVHLPDMDIVIRQAWLMEAGSKVFKALKRGEMADILTGLAGLADCALAAIARQGEDVLEQPVFWRHDGSVLSVMSLLSDKIGACASGKAIDYSAVYCACARLATGFLNADFDRAMHMYQDYRTEILQQGADDGSLEGASIDLHAVDLSECLYE